MDVIHASPETPDGLETALSHMATAGVALLIIDGGDGTVRDVLTQVRSTFNGSTPLLAVIPHGKTNALAHDLGVPRGWSVQAAIASAQDPRRRATRPLLEVVHAGESAPRTVGFVFGTGAYVEATRLATRAHRIGVIDSLAVGFALLGAGLGVLLGGRGFTRGQSVRLDDEPPHDRFLLLASTLERFPLGLKPFGSLGPGLKLLDVDAPPRRLAAALVAILSGRDPSWLVSAGYRRRRIDQTSLSGPDSYVLDGEIYPGGDITVRRGPDLLFVTA